MRKALRKLAAILAVPVLALAAFAGTASAGTAGYLYLNSWDTTHAVWAFANAKAETQLNVQAGEHSLTEMAMVNGGAVAEIGVTADPNLNQDSSGTEHVFVSTWNGYPSTSGWLGYNAASKYVAWTPGGGVCGGGTGAQPPTDVLAAGQLGLQPGVAVANGTTVKVGLEFYQGNLWVYANGWAGYFPGTIWSGGFTQAGYTAVYGEVYYNGSQYPTMNGLVSGYVSSTGAKLVQGSTPSGPYAQSNFTGTGFNMAGGGFSG